MYVTRVTSPYWMLKKRINRRAKWVEFDGKMYYCYVEGKLKHLRMKIAKSGWDDEHARI